MRVVPVANHRGHGWRAREACRTTVRLRDQRGENNLQACVPPVPPLAASLRPCVLRRTVVRSYKAFHAPRLASVCCVLGSRAPRCTCGACFVPERAVGPRPWCNLDGAAWRACVEPGGDPMGPEHAGAPAPRASGRLRGAGAAQQECTGGVRFILPQRLPARAQLAVSTQAPSPHEAAPLLPRPLPRSALTLAPAARSDSAQDLAQRAPRLPGARLHLPVGRLFALQPACAAVYGTHSRGELRARGRYAHMLGCGTLALLAFSNHTVRPGSIVRHCQKCNKVTR